MTCECKFDPQYGDEESPSIHYGRVCKSCGKAWPGLHCPHDSRQGPCIHCGKRPGTQRRADAT